MGQGIGIGLEAPQGRGIPAFLEPGNLESRVREAVRRAAEYLLSLQAREGYWVAELQADTTVESDYIFCLHILGRAHPVRILKLANYIRQKQLAEGGWNIYEGGPSELDATIKAYLALRVAGDSPQAPHMVRARERVHALGGIEGTKSYTRFYLALCGAVRWENVPAIPPELLLLPARFFLSIYAMSSWSRAIVVPLTILYALKPRWPLPPSVRVAELFRNGSGSIPAFNWDRGIVSWRNFFLALDRLARTYERLPWKPLRRRALAKARWWLLEHLERGDGLGAIYPAMVNSVLALLALGYPADDPLTAREIGHLAQFEIEQGDTIRIQPCVSPVWDTATAMTALEEAGLPPHHAALVKSAKWLLERQVVSGGDWQVANPEVEPGGWAFEFRNDAYPDVDDASFVLMALQRVAFPAKERQKLALRRGVSWMLGMQNPDGGWGAFDRDNACAILTRVPFADHNAMIDPSTEDVTARVLECLGCLGWSPSDAAVERGLRFLEKQQTAEGAWYGRWGVNYIYGTSGVLRALETLGLGGEGMAQRALAWLRSVQNPDGGFGESCASYDDPSLKGQGPSTPSQTAWGLIGLLAAGDVWDPAVARAVHYLLRHQKPDGSWEEEAFTGTGFPRVFYLRYHMYRNSFPLYALARCAKLLGGGTRFEAVHFSPKEFEQHFGNGRKP